MDKAFITYVKKKKNINFVVLSATLLFQVSIEDGKLFGTANIYDTASLIKQFFRELPEPIFATVYHESFIKCFNLSPDKDPVSDINFSLPVSVL